MSEVLAHQGRALTPEETEELLRDRLGEHVQRAVTEYGVFTLWIAPEGWLEAARHCRDERLLAYDMFDSLFGIDAREDGFDVVAVLYSTSTGNRIALRARCPGGRQAPSLPSIAEVYRGADWMERETYDMFGVDFTGHPGLEPRILTVENFEGWPLRKDFHLASRVAKPWPGVAEPVELDEDGNKIERERSIGDAPGPYELDKAMAEQARVVNAPPAPAVEAEPEPTEAATGQQEEVATSPVADEGAAAPDAAAPEQDPAARAKAKAEERRKRQAEARAAKAQARAEKAKQAQAGPAAAEAAPTAEVEPEAEAPAASEAAPEPVAEQPVGPEAASEEDGDVDPRVAARRKRQAEARAARAKARADKAGGGAAPAAPAAPAEEPTPTSEATPAETAPTPAAPAEATTEAPTEAAPEPGAPEPAAPESTASGAPTAPEQPSSDDPASAARAKAEARRKRQAEARAARAKARAEKEQRSETDGEGDA